MQGDAPLGPQSEAGIGVRPSVPLARRNLLNAAARGLLLALAAFGGIALLERPKLAGLFAGLGFGAFAAVLAYVEVWAERAAPLSLSKFGGLVGVLSLLAAAGLLFMGAQYAYTDRLLGGASQQQALDTALSALRVGWHPGVLIYLSLNLGLASALRVALGRDLGMGQLFELGRGAAVLLLALSLPLWAPLGVTLFAAWVADGFEARAAQVLRPKT